MNWNNCFSDDRFGVESFGKGIRSEYEVDWDRIIFSSPFRRLQNKTQVFPLPEEVFVHNRLTHSLEVASVGRSLGAIVGMEIARNKEVKANESSVSFYRNDLKQVVSTACLAHDMGNPAFGHAGEEAISKYFIDHGSATVGNQNFKSLFTEAQWCDLTHFEGNANALRILTRQQTGRLHGGFRLTYSTLGSILKYPCESLATERTMVHRKKYGFFQDDTETFLKITAKLNMQPDANESHTVFMRHPFVFLVEAADDICYNIIDYEDAHRLKILSYNEVKESMLAIIEKDERNDIDDTKAKLKAIENDSNEAVAYLRAKSINCLANKCANVFLENQSGIINGKFNFSLLDGVKELQDVLKTVVNKSRKQIYNHESVVRIELAGFRIMSGLIEDLVEAALIDKSKRSKRHEKLIDLMPSQYKFDELADPYVKVMHILDHISGMTDLYALKLYKNLRGIEMPHI
jgi:dGTPase